MKMKLKDLLTLKFKELSKDSLEYYELNSFKDELLECDEFSDVENIVVVPTRTFSTAEHDSYLTTTVKLHDSIKFNKTVYINRISLGGILLTQKEGEYKDLDEKYKDNFMTGFIELMKNPEKYGVEYDMRHIFIEGSGFNETLKGNPEVIYQTDLN